MGNLDHSICNYDIFGSYRVVEAIRNSIHDIFGHEFHNSNVMGFKEPREVIPSFLFRHFRNTK